MITGTLLQSFMLELLANGKKLEMKKLKGFDKNHSCPPFSKVIMTPNAYLTDKVWSDLAKQKPFV